MNAPYGWHVPGGTAEGVELADIEHSWDLSHQDLVDVSVDRVHPQTRPDTRHGTAVLGVIAAYAAAQLIESLLFGVGARDLLTFVSVPVVLLCVAAAASLIPAVRASRVDPVDALREE